MASRRSQRLGKSKTEPIGSVTPPPTSTGTKKSSSDSESAPVAVILDKSSKSLLFHHASDILREGKGGYLQGRIRLPSAPRPLFVRLSLLPVFVDATRNPFHLHPNLLHVKMGTIKKTKKLKDGELPDDVDWAFVFQIKDEEVFRVCPPTNPSLKSGRFRKNMGLNNRHDNENQELETEDRAEYAHRLFENDQEPLCLGPLNLPSEPYYAHLASLEDGSVDLGKTGLMINIVLPLQRIGMGGTGTTVTDVLKQRYEDLFKRDIDPVTLDEVVDVYINNKEEGRIKLQSVRLSAEVFTAEGQFITSSCSEVITNSKSKECGPLQLRDVNPAVSCCNGETKIFILSFFKLVADVQAVFILYDPAEDQVVRNRHYDLMSEINQPDSCSVFNNICLVFNAPKQSFEVIRKIKQLGLQLRVTAYRPSDHKMAASSFEFTYMEHNANAECSTCFVLLRSSRGEVAKLPSSKPGVKRHVSDLVEPVESALKAFKAKAAIDSNNAHRAAKNKAEAQLSPSSRRSASDDDIVVYEDNDDEIITATVPPPKKRLCLRDAFSHNEK